MTHRFLNDFSIKGKKFRIFRLFLVFENVGNVEWLTMTRVIVMWHME